MNSLIGVLCRFREKPVAVISDIERMFQHFRVRAEDRDYLCFLWLKDGDITKDPITYRMKVHLFGATSSPGCAVYGLKKLAKDHGTKFSKEVVDFLTRDFYVDDRLLSCDTANIRLHKFLSYNRQVIESVPPTERCSDVTTLDFAFSNLPLERVLGVQWSVESDQFKFRLNVSE